jgi:hypothetical protein
MIGICCPRLIPNKYIFTRMTRLGDRRAVMTQQTLLESSVGEVSGIASVGIAVAERGERNCPPAGHVHVRHGQDPNAQDDPP